MGFLGKFIAVAVVILGAGMGGIYLHNYLNKEPKASSLATAEVKIEGEDLLANLGDNATKLVANTEGNKDFWDWKYKNILSPDLPSLDENHAFKKVNIGFNLEEKNKDFSLNRVCENSYKSKKETITNKEAIIKYCTISGTEDLKIA